jgi:hypothetical protein
MTAAGGAAGLSRGRSGEIRPKRSRRPKPEYLDRRTFDSSMFANKDDAVIEKVT